MTVLDHDPVVTPNISHGIQPPRELRRVSKGDFKWTDRQIGTTIFGAAAVALVMAIGIYLIKK